MRYRLRTLLILLAIGPPLGAGAWEAWRERQIELTRKQLIEAIRAYKTGNSDFLPPARNDSPGLIEAPADE